MKLTCPKISLGSRTLTTSSSAFVIVLGLLAALAIPVLVDRQAGPDALTLWNSYARADNCDFWSPFSESRSSYECTAYVLRPTGIGLYNAWIYGAICNLLLTVLPFAFFKRVSLPLLLTMLVWAVVRGFFLENLTKEIIVGFAVVMMMVSARLGRPWIGIAGVGLLYGVMIRPYWVLAIVTWLGLLTLHPRLSYTRFLSVLPAFYACAALAISGLLGGTLTGFRQSSNEARVIGEEGSRSLIAPIFSGSDLVSQTLDTTLIFFRLLFPFELVLLSGAQQIAFVGITVITLCTCLHAFIRCPDESGAVKLLAFPVAFLMIQAIFEPDFGSFARHFSLVAPIAFCGIGIWMSERAEQQNGD